MAFKDRLKEARLNNNLTQEQIAEKIGVAKSTFTGYEKGNSEPSMLTISRIMNILKVDANFLWQDEMNALGGNPIQVKYEEMKLLEKYRALDPSGQEHVNTVLDHESDRVQQIKELHTRPAAVVELPQGKQSVLDAAHERTDIEVTDEMRKHDDAIMDDDSEWE